jgi:hypothetical protein
MTAAVNLDGSRVLSGFRGEPPTADGGCIMSLAANQGRIYGAARALTRRLLRPIHVVSPRQHERRAGAIWAFISTAIGCSQPFSPARIEHFAVD